LSYGVAGRLARIDPMSEIVFTEKKSGKAWHIPPGTPVGMSNAQIHLTASIFPDPHSFNPDRWLDDGVIHQRLDRYLCSFMRGSRQCLGMNLAWAEMYLSMSAIWGRFGSKAGIKMEGGSYEGVRMEGDIGVLELWETGLKDVELYADSFLPLVKPGSVGIRVKIWE